MIYTAAMHALALLLQLGVLLAKTTLSGSVTQATNGNVALVAARANESESIGSDLAKNMPQSLAIISSPFHDSHQGNNISQTQFY